MTLFSEHLSTSRLRASWSLPGRFGTRYPERCAAVLKGSLPLPLQRGVSAGGRSCAREGGNQRAGHEPGGWWQPRWRVRHELCELRQREAPPVADRPDRQRQVPRAGVGERGEEHLPHPLEARGQAGLQPRGGRSPLQGYTHVGSPRSGWGRAPEKRMGPEFTLP